MSREEGLKHKYHVERVDGKPLGQCIVLEFDDPNAWPALTVWAETVRANGYERLSDDVHHLLSRSMERREEREGE